MHAHYSVMSRLFHVQVLTIIVLQDDQTTLQSKLAASMPSHNNCKKVCFGTKYQLVFWFFQVFLRFFPGFGSGPYE